MPWESTGWTHDRNVTQLLEFLAARGEVAVASQRVGLEATAEGFEGRTALLSPFNRLIHDRTGVMELFDFEYTLEMYKPQATRRWGYFAHVNRCVPNSAMSRLWGLAAGGIGVAERAGPLMVAVG